MLFIFLFNQKQPKPGNGRCEVGHALSFSLHQDAGVVSEHIGRYSTCCKKYVNDFAGTLLKFVLRNQKQNLTRNTTYMGSSNSAGDSYD